MKPPGKRRAAALVAGMALVLCLGSPSWRELCKWLLCLLGQRWRELCKRLLRPERQRIWRDICQKTLVVENKRLRDLSGWLLNLEILRWKEILEWLTSLSARDVTAAEPTPPGKHRCRQTPGILWVTFPNNRSRLLALPSPHQGIIAKPEEVFGTAGRAFLKEASGTVTLRLSARHPQGLTRQLVQQRGNAWLAELEDWMSSILPVAASPRGFKCTALSHTGPSLTFTASLRDIFDLYNALAAAERPLQLRLSLLGTLDVEPAAMECHSLDHPGLPDAVLLSKPASRLQNFRAQLVFGCGPAGPFIAPPAPLSCNFQDQPPSIPVRDAKADFLGRYVAYTIREAAPAQGGDGLETFWNDTEYEGFVADVSPCGPRGTAAFHIERERERNEPCDVPNHRLLLAADPALVSFHYREAPGRLPDAFAASLLRFLFWNWGKRHAEPDVVVAKCLEKLDETLEEIASCCGVEVGGGRHETIDQLLEETIITPHLAEALRRCAGADHLCGQKSPPAPQEATARLCDLAEVLAEDHGFAALTSDKRSALNDVLSGQAKAVEVQSQGNFSPHLGWWISSDLQMGLYLSGAAYNSSTVRAELRLFRSSSAEPGASTPQPDWREDIECGLQDLVGAASGHAFTLIRTRKGRIVTFQGSLLGMLDLHNALQQQGEPHHLHLNGVGAVSVGRRIELIAISAGGSSWALEGAARDPSTLSGIWRRLKSASIYTILSNPSLFASLPGLSADGPCASTAKCTTPDDEKALARKAGNRADAAKRTPAALGWDAPANPLEGLETAAGVLKRGEAAVHAESSPAGQEEPGARTRSWDAAVVPEETPAAVDLDEAGSFLAEASGDKESAAKAEGGGLKAVVAAPADARAQAGGNANGSVDSAVEANGAAATDFESAAVGKSLDADVEGEADEKAISSGGAANMAVGDVPADTEEDAVKAMKVSHDVREEADANWADFTADADWSAGAEACVAASDVLGGAIRESTGSADNKGPTEGAGASVAPEEAGSTEGDAHDRGGGAAAVVLAGTGRESSGSAAVETEAAMDDDKAAGAASFVHGEGDRNSSGSGAPDLEEMDDGRAGPGADAVLGEAENGIGGPTADDTEGPDNQKTDEAPAGLLGEAEDGRRGSTCATGGADVGNAGGAAAGVLGEAENGSHRSTGPDAEGPAVDRAGELPAAVLGESDGDISGSPAANTGGHADKAADGVAVVMPRETDAKSGGFPSAGTGGLDDVAASGGPSGKPANKSSASSAAATHGSTEDQADAANVVVHGEADADDRSSVAADSEGLDYGNAGGAASIVPGGADSRRKGPCAADTGLDVNEVALAVQASGNVVGNEVAAGNCRGGGEADNGDRARSLDSEDDYKGSSVHAAAQAGGVCKANASGEVAGKDNGSVRFKLEEFCSLSDGPVGTAGRAHDDSNAAGTLDDEVGGGREAAGDIGAAGVILESSRGSTDETRGEAGDTERKGVSDNSGCRDAPGRSHATAALKEGDPGSVVAPFCAQTGSAVEANSRVRSEGVADSKAKDQGAPALSTNEPFAAGMGTARLSGMSGHGKRSEELLTAARGGNTNAVRALMAFGVDVNARDEFGRAALHIASRNGCEVLVGLLLEGVGSQRADINATDKFGRTALHEGAREGHEAVVRLLLNGIGGQLPDMNAVDRLGRTPFHEAEGHTTVEQLLMEAASGAGSTGNQATSSSPPIEKLGNGAEGAINEGFEAFAAAGEGLLRSQADVNAADELGRVDVAALLLKGGGQQPAGANAEDREGKMALLEGREADMGLMLEAGGDIAEMNQEGGAALEEALCAGHGEATFLVKEGASCPTSNPASRNGRMALHQAARKGDEDAVRRLVEDEGAEINATTSRKMTALHEAARNGHEGVVRMLLGGVGGQRARINARTKTGMTALHMAARNGQERVVMLLLDGAMGERADINATDNSGRTALHEASQHGHDRIVTLLLQGLGGAGAHSNATDKCGRTAPDDGHVHEQAVKLLEKAGGRAGSELKPALGKKQRASRPWGALRSVSIEVREKSWRQRPKPRDRLETGE